MQSKLTSRISGFHRKNLEERLQTVLDMDVLSADSAQHLLGGGQVDGEVVDRMSENVIATQSLPFSLALNFRVNGADVLVPMAVEEPSIVAAASNAARLIRLSGGFSGEADLPVMTAQVQLTDVPSAADAPAAIEAERAALIDAANESIPRMVARGGGCVDVETRVLHEARGIVVLHFYVNVGDAMGANLVDTVAEAVAPRVQRIIGGRIGLRILSNLPLRRMVRVSCAVSEDAIGSAELSDAIADASDFASLDPFRAVTHNKGVMNAIDAVALALGQDWRAIEAGAHAYASLSGVYRPLAVWTRSESGLEGTLEMPLAVATVGGSTSAHPGVRAAFELMRVDSARQLAVVMGAAGLACNLAALRALAGEGIQKGHMRLHARKQPAVPAQARREEGRR